VCIPISYLDLRVQGGLLAVVFLILIWVHANVVESKLFLDAVLEQLALLEGERVGLGDDRDDVDGLAQLLQNNNIDRLERVTSWGDEVQAAVDAGVLNVSLTLRGELLAQVGAVLVLDVFHNGVPAAVIVNEVAVAGGVDDVQTQTNAILLDDVGDGVDLSGAADGLVGEKATLALDQVGSEDGVDEGGFTETGLS
jgi:hypothetical protein